MRITTLIAGLLAAVLVIGYGGWLSSESSTGSDGTSQTGKPGEAPKD